MKLITAFTAGGNNEADIATPTSDAIFSPKIAIATAAPDGIAVNAPITSEWISHLCVKEWNGYSKRE